MVTACDVLFVGAHPDDVELGCGATAARLAAAGRRVGILDLTAGELATRGTVEARRSEAAAAALALGAAWRGCLSLPDGGLRGEDDAQVAAVVGAIRGSMPRALFLPHSGDPHVDHWAAAELGRRAVFLSGVRQFHAETGAPHRPRLVLAYPGPRQLFAPTVVVDVAAHYAAKRAALTAHASQFAPGAGPATHLASGHFLAAIEGRDRASGNLIGCEFGEGFVAPDAIAGHELAWLLGCGS